MKNLTNSKIITLFLFSILLSYSQPLNAQYLVKHSLQGNTTIYEDTDPVTLYSKIGIGTSTPSVHLHSVSNYANGDAFKIELRVNSAGISTFYGSLESYVVRGAGQMYGLYQTAPNRNVVNYFEHPLGIGILQPSEMLDVAGDIKLQSKITLTGSSPRVSLTSPEASQFQFRFDPTGQPSPDPSIPLIIKPIGIQVNGIAECNTFQMHYGAAAGRVLVSNADGLGLWTDASDFNDHDWERSPSDNLYANCVNVGIGTERPEDKLQINSGPTKLTIGDAGGANLNWGTSYLGFNASRQNTGWLISGNTVDNGGGVIMGDIFGAIRFINIPTVGGMNQTKTDSEILTLTSMTITKDGNVGLGTQNPIAALDIYRNGASTVRVVSGSSNVSTLCVKNSYGNYGFLVDDRGIGHISELIDNNPPNHIISFLPSGRVGIGSIDNLANYSGNSLLFVTGGITTEEVTVKLKTDWADFVFNQGYKLPSITELGQYIETYKHLPGIPTENDIKENGIEVGKMNTLLLQKIEELTLYVIELKKEIDEIKTEKGN